MTLPPPVLAGLQTGNRGMRRRAPVSDRPGASLAAAGPSLPPLRRRLLSLALPEALFFTGIDWASQEHAVCVLGADGKSEEPSSLCPRRRPEPWSRSCPSSAQQARARRGRTARRQAGGRLAGGGPPGCARVAPTRSSRGESQRWCRGQDDPGDAEVIAEYLRLRQHRLRIAAPYSDQTKALRTVMRTRDDLVAMRVASTNQLSALLEAHWPGARAIFADVESPISLAFLTRYPTPASAASLGEKRIAAFCASQGYSGKRPAAVLLARLRSAPAGTTGAALTRALRDAVLALVAVLTALNAADQGPGPLRRRPARRASGRRRSSRRCQGRVRSTPPRCSPSGATAAKPTTDPTPSPPWPGAPPSPGSPASTAT